MQYACVVCVRVLFMSEASVKHATATAARVAVVFVHVDSVVQFTFLPFFAITTAPLFIDV